MKLRNILTGIFFLLATVAYAQESEQDSITVFYQKFPQQALKDAQKMYQQAINEHNSPLLIKSLILKSTFALEIDRDDYPTILNELEGYIAKETDTVARCILHSYIGQLYTQFYSRNRSSIDQRTAIKDFVPENMNEWSSENFNEKIFFHLLASIAPQVILQRTPVSMYNAVLITGSSSATLRPTVYDFLCHRAIQFIQRNDQRNLAGEGSYLPGMLSVAKEFVHLPIQAIPMDSRTNILKIWQELLGFRMQAGNTDAFIMADLERLEYINNTYRQNSQDSSYLKTLQQMHKEYANNPISVEIIVAEAHLLLNKSYEIQPLSHFNDKEILKKKQEALTLCEEGIRLFPDYSRINQLRTIITNIKTPDLLAEFPKTIYPGEKLKLKLSFRNITSINIKLYRLDTTTVYSLETKRRKNIKQPTTKISETKYQLPSTFVTKDSVLEITVPRCGLYQLAISTPNKKEGISDNFICTRLFTTTQEINKQFSYFVCDWQSGKPVKNAQVIIYKYKSQSYLAIDTLLSDIHGMAHTKTSSEFYEVVNAENPNGQLLRPYRDRIRSEETTHVDIITDRKIYRPGQTVFYKAISWKNTPDTLYPLAKKSYEIIFRDANNKEVARQKMTSNKFGSFSGSFVIPQGGLNGGFSIAVNNSRNYITVSDYKRPEFEITLNKPEQNYRTGDMVSIKGNVSSFSGVKIANNTVTYNIVPTTFYRSSNHENSIQGITSTDAAGDFKIAFRAEQLSDPLYFSYYYSVTATVTDSKGETQENTIHIPIYSGTPTPSIQIPQQVNQKAKTAFVISLDNVSPDAEQQTVSYVLSKLVTPTQITLNPEIKDTLIEKMVLEGTLSIQKKDSIFPNLSQMTPGAYLFTIECKGQKTERIFYLYNPQDKKPPVPTYNWLITEKTQCRPGESAQIQFGTSARNTYVIYQLFSPNKLLKQSFLNLSDEIVNLSIPFKAEYGNTIWVILTYVKNKEYIKQIVPITRARENRKLTIETKVFRDKLIPGQKEQWELRIANEDKQAVSAEVLAMMYDASLDKLAPYHPSFRPDYLRQYLPNDWADDIYSFRGSNYISANGWATYKSYPVPPLRFNQLNTYGNSFVNTRGTLKLTGSYADNEIFASFGDVLMESKVQSNQPAAGEQGNSFPVTFRQNFQETAFFYPQLQTDSAGEVIVKFTVPESDTKWKFIAIAYTQELAAGQTEQYITTEKPLMVRPNLPRFLRNGDRAEIKVSISNLSDSLQQGETTLELFVPGNNEKILSRTTTFRTEAGQNQTVTFSFDVPAHINLAGCRISAQSNHFSDGEQHLLPILSDKILITESLPFYTNQAGEHYYSLKAQSSTRKDYRLTFEVTANPIWYAVLALPALTEPAHENVTDIASAYYVNTIAAMITRANPKIAETIHQWKATDDKTTFLSKLEQNSELKSILLSASPWVMQAQNETERMQSLAQLFDQNRLDYLQEQMLDKLAGLQQTDGGWGWFKGMYSSRFMTANVLTILARANTTGQKEYGQREKMMQINALRYLDKEIKEDHKFKTKKISYNQLIYLYVRSMYRDIPLGDALEAHKYFMAQALSQWSSFSLYEKAIAAVAMYNYGQSDESRKILSSLQQYAVTKPDLGMYWPNNRNVSYKNSAVQIHTAIMEAFHEIEGNSPELDRMKQWLLRQKQTQDWTGVPATVDAIYALLLTGSSQLDVQENISVQLGKHSISSAANDNPLGYIKQSYSAAEITPEMSGVKLTKVTNTPTWGGLYLQYFEKIDQVKESGTNLKVGKELFIEQAVPGGSKELIPVARQAVRIGDKIIVRLTLSLDRDMEFLYLKDLRAACFEPVNQISGNHWKFGTAYYEEIKDATTTFFFNALSRGTYVIEYPVWANQAGEYQDGIATFQSFYAPEFNAFSKAGTINIVN